MNRVIIAFFISGLMFLVSGCAVVDAQESCRARGGTWSEYDAIGQKIWPGRCVGARTSEKEHCERIREAIRQGSFQKLPSYCE
jgi:hypothetical protein